MSQLISGSICVTDIVEWANKLHSAYSRSNKNQKIYANVAIWVNDEPDQFGNHASIQLNSHKDGEEKDKAMTNGKKVYIGSGKKIEMGPKPLQAGENTGLNLGGPAATGFQKPNTAANPWGGAGQPGNDELPF